MVGEASKEIKWKLDVDGFPTIGSYLQRKVGGILGRFAPTSPSSFRVLFTVVDLKE
jgi:hypothetical protein